MANNPLGKPVPFPTAYDPSLLFRIARAESRRGQAANLFQGYDRWRCYEFIGRDRTGRSTARILEIDVPASSPFLVESKSLKLYLHSLSCDRFHDRAALLGRVTRDLETLLETQLRIEFDDGALARGITLPAPPGECIDHCEIEQVRPEDAPALLLSDGEITAETLHSNLFRSRCPVTGQPDWASVIISYRGKQIRRGPLLSYLLSFTEQAEFHEHCCEKIFLDLLERCGPEQLFVWCAFSRRGGIEINPVRFTPGFGDAVAVTRLVRQ